MLGWGGYAFNTKPHIFLPLGSFSSLEVFPLSCLPSGDWPLLCTPLPDTFTLSLESHSEWLSEEAQKGARVSVALLPVLQWHPQPSSFNYSNPLREETRQALVVSTNPRIHSKLRFSPSLPSAQRSTRSTIWFLEVSLLSWHHSSPRGTHKLFQDDSNVT